MLEAWDLSAKASGWLLTEQWDGCRWSEIGYVLLLWRVNRCDGWKNLRSALRVGMLISGGQRQDQISERRVSGMMRTLGETADGASGLDSNEERM